MLTNIQKGSLKRDLNIRHLHKKEGTDSRVSCLSIALILFKKPAVENELTSTLHKKGKGITLHQIHLDLTSICSSLKSIYFSEVLPGRGPKLSFEDIRRYINYGCPILIGVINFEERPTHTLLIYGYDTYVQQLMIADPYLENGFMLRYQKLKELIWFETLIITD